MASATAQQRKVILGESAAIPSRILSIARSIREKQVAPPMNIIELIMNITKLDTQPADYEYHYTHTKVTLG